MTKELRGYTIKIYIIRVGLKEMVYLKLVQDQKSKCQGNQKSVSLNIMIQIPLVHIADVTFMLLPGPQNTPHAYHYSLKQA